MSFEELVDYIDSKIEPYSLNDTGKKNIANLYNKYPINLIMECVDIGIKQYFIYDENNSPTSESVDAFLNRLGGILYNKSKSPVEQEILHVQGLAQKQYAYWNKKKAAELLYEYINVLRSIDWSEDQILNDLQNDVIKLTNQSKNWTEWSNTIMRWINELSEEENNDTVSITQKGTILPEELLSIMPEYMKRLAQQINASYESNLFDCTAVMMRRLLEVLLILTYQNNGIESEITDYSGRYYLRLDTIIRNAKNNTNLSLSANTKNDMDVFKDLGNFSAHKIWYNCTQQDIQKHLLIYRAMIEEFLYKAGIKQ